MGGGLRPSVLRPALAALLVLGMGQMARATSEPAQVWAILEIAGRAATGDAYLSVDVEGNAAGSSGCNRFQTRVTQSGMWLRFGPIAATRMACPPATARQEAALFGLLGRRLSLSYHVLRDQLTLTAEDGTRLVLQRSE